jgi:hypothetical protein
MKIDELTLDLLAFLSGRINRLEVEPSDERRGGIVSLTTRPWRWQEEPPHQRERGGMAEGSCSDFPLYILRLEPGHRNLKALGLFDHRLGVRFAVIPIPERMPDSVAALDLDRCALLATLLTLTAGLVVDAAGPDQRSRAFFAAPPQVRAEVGHIWIIGRGPSRIKSANYSVSPWNRSIQCRHCRLPETSDMFGSPKPPLLEPPLQSVVLGLLGYSVERLRYRRSVRYVHHYGGDTVSRVALQNGPVRLAPHSSEHPKAVSREAQAFPIPPEVPVTNTTFPAFIDGLLVRLQFPLFSAAASRSISPAKSVS